MLNKKSQFYFLFVLIMLSIFTAFVFKQVFPETKNHSYLYTEFTNEIYYVVNSGIYNQLPLNEVLLKYFNDFFLFLRKQDYGSKLVYFINYNGSVFAYNTYPNVEIDLTNGTKIMMAYNESKYLNSDHFKILVNGQEYSLTLDKNYDQYYVLNIF